ncbi:MAG: hypothetical protein HDR92_03595 [Bacteroides sp.]|nr:hypothetical protein [Bacteroides sp.]
MTTHTLSPSSSTSGARITDFRRSAARLFPLVDDTSELTLVCSRSDYSASAIARAAEDCDAHLINLNVTSDPAPDGRPDSIVVELRISRRDPSAVARSLTRYGYDVVDTRTQYSDTSDERAMERLRELVRHLEV